MVEGRFVGTSKKQRESPETSEYTVWDFEVLRWRSFHEGGADEGRVKIIATPAQLADAPGLLMRFVGFTGPEPKLPPPVRRRVGKDLPAVARLMSELADVSGLTRIIPSHGSIIETGAPDVLRMISRELS